MKTKLLALALLAGSTMFAETRFSIGVNLGGYDRGYYPPPAAYVDVRPPCPGPDYGWVDGYWDQYSGRRSWHNGYWARQAYRGYREGPRYEGGYYNGYRRNDSGRGYEHDRRGGRGDDRGRGHGYGNGFRNR